jgi:hypothetical protein
MTTFGIDFGTTNSLVATVVGDRALTLVDSASQRPHPSMIWYRGAEVIVGREARQHIDITESGAPTGFLRSPKMALRREGPIFVEGRSIDPTDAVAEILKHLVKDAKVSRGHAASYQLDRAVFTIPVDFGGTERRALRNAARKAGIGVTQFVHEPVAALYAFLRSHPERARELERLEGRSVLVFDWGGGTLDLTLCRIQGGSIMQIANVGNNEVGGDQFDNRLRNLLRERHAAHHGLKDITALEYPGMAAKLLNQCELIKIQLSDPNVESADFIIRNYLRTEGAAQNLVGSVSRKEFEASSSNIVTRGLAQIDRILEQAGLTYQDIELCLATGGMVNMLAIQRGLTERFIGRVPTLKNGDRIIAEGAAWIAHDGLRLKLSKPIEILIADSSTRGAYHPLVSAGLELPMENQITLAANSRLYCVDPREGVAVIEFAKPTKIGNVAPSDARTTLCVTSVPVDSNASPLLERLECQLHIDHDYVATVKFSSTGKGSKAIAEFHDLDFGLALPRGDGPKKSDRTGGDVEKGGGNVPRATLKKTNVTQRPNIVMMKAPAESKDPLWRLVPGDIVSKWRPGHFDNRTATSTERQNEELGFYIPCASCQRLISQILAEGPTEACRGRSCNAQFGVR